MFEYRTTQTPSLKLYTLSSHSKKASAQAKLVNKDVFANATNKTKKKPVSNTGYSQ